MKKVCSKYYPLIIALLLIVSAVAYWVMGYQTIRHESLQVVGLYLFLTIIFWLIYQFASGKKEILLLIAAGIFFRFIFLFSEPNLSDDYLRYLWDGKLTVQGVNPYSYKPTDVNYGKSIAYNDEMQQLVRQKDYYTIYPPIAQTAFAFAAFVSPQDLGGAILTLRILVLLFEIGTIFIILQLLKQWQIPVKKALLYAINPLVIIELSGNLHTEVLMIFFVLLSVWMLQKSWILSSVAMGFAIAVKLWPILFLLPFIKMFSLKRTILYSTVSLITFFLLFLPFNPTQIFPNIISSSKLYFIDFEFNAGIYYLTREIGYLIKGYNLISVIGPLLSIITVLLILFFVFFNNREKQKDLLHYFLWLLGIYLLLSTTINPWYLTPLVAFSVFSKTKFALAWQSVVFASYFAFKSEFIVEENYLIIFAEYAAVFTILLLDLKQEVWISLKDFWLYKKLRLR